MRFVLTFTIAFLSAAFIGHSYLNASEKADDIQKLARVETTAPPKAETKSTGARKPKAARDVCVPLGDSAGRVDGRLDAVCVLQGYDRGRKLAGEHQHDGQIRDRRHDLWRRHERQTNGGDGQAPASGQ